VDLGFLLHALMPSWNSVSPQYSNPNLCEFIIYENNNQFTIFSPFYKLVQVPLLAGFFTYLAIAGSILPGKLVPGVALPDATRLHYRCNGQL